MKKQIIFGSIAIIGSLFFSNMCQAQQDRAIKIKMEINADDLGNAQCVMENKYTAEAWDVFTKTIGNNTSILKNNMIRIFPKYELSDFEYSQDGDDRTNTIKFKILGFLEIDNNGNWVAKLEKKDPEITKLTESSFLLMEDGQSLKINLPSGTSGAKITKDSFGMAAISYPANEGGGKSLIFLGVGIAVMALGAFMLRKNMKQPAIRTIYEPAQRTNEKLNPSAIHQLSQNSKSNIQSPSAQQPGANTGQPDYEQY